MNGISLLLEMLTYKRPAGSRSERRFIRRFIVPTGATPDSFGNYLLRVGDAPVAWCSHTDTVHQMSGRQALSVSGGVVRSHGTDCLGADDTTGVWLMLEMIRAKVPGLYIFHRAEEIGCRGALHIADRTPEVLDGIVFAIEFDRRGTDSVVTHQLGRRTCSDEFAWSLAAQLPGDMVPDPGGVYTDTECYAHMIPECTNVSVGYTGQHTSLERQDLAFAKAMRDALVRIDVSQFIEAREPVEDVWEPADDPWPALLAQQKERAEEYGGEECAICGTGDSAHYMFAGGIVCRPCFDVLTVYKVH